MPFGNQRAFFAKIWGRLHGTVSENVPPLPEESGPLKTPEDAKPSSAPCIIPKLEGESPDSLQALYAQLNKNNATMKKMVNEAA